MIGKFVMCSRQLDPWHVAGNALVFGHRAGLRAGLSASRLYAVAMASQAFRVEIHRLSVEVMVRVVARKATDSRVIRVITFAARQAVGLEADVGNRRVVLLNYFRPGPVTLATEIGSLVRGELDQLGQLFWYCRSRTAG